MRIFQRIHNKLNWSNRRYATLIISMLAVGYLASAIYHTYKPLPEDLNYTGKLRHAEVKFLADQTYLDAEGKQHLDHRIFNEMLKMIEEAKSLIVLDMFLFNQQTGASTQHHQALSKQLSDALISKRLLQPEVEIKFITDPINSVYGGIRSEQYRELRQHGIDVIETNLTPLRASNPSWSGFWYICCQGIGNNPETGWLPNPFGTEKITLRSYFDLFNFKANHRKTMVVDTDQGWKALVTSMNPHDGSSRHSNIGLLVWGSTAVDILKTELSVGMMSQANMPAIVAGDFQADISQPQVQVLTEKAIYDAILNLIQTAKANEQIDLAMFYLSERKIIKSLIAAHERGVKVRILLDPNKDAFGREKNGIPNRQVASELHEAGIEVRWCRTQGEQCHSKILMKRSAQQAEMILGSANFTVRNLKNYNLETNMRVVGQPQAEVFREAQQYFEGAWSNLNGRSMSVDYTQYAENSFFKYWLYRFMEWSGWSTF
ncbi:phospholipase D-like domain-containing protein [Acinetobacter lwoffii]|uniref:phospholipase D-like domain-containing protein n=1 Tax=Acinetobacter lwoffii TaxID=28090 RepID=UPI000D6222E4|nr:MULTISPECIES: phospholipase D-like domain-containing protein [Pseudomonadota]MCO8072575.1 phospholipase D-like domain-containing protein [Acinetobacter lwoffii]MCO8075553.1 phospholipase D-like domain-containing protein [Acinetobacter lwoffii]SPJ20840.1 cardiolipin synthetase [Prolinoborus fasciculus]